MLDSLFFPSHLTLIVGGHGDSAGGPKKECRDWANGDCKHGENCPFVHGATGGHGPELKTSDGGHGLGGRTGRVGARGRGSMLDSLFFPFPT